MVVFSSASPSLAFLIACLFLSFFFFLDCFFSHGFTHCQQIILLFVGIMPLPVKGKVVIPMLIVGTSIAKYLILISNYRWFPQVTSTKSQELSSCWICFICMSYNIILAAVLNACLVSFRFSRSSIEIACATESPLPAV